MLSSLLYSDTAHLDIPSWIIDASYVQQAHLEGERPPTHPLLLSSIAPFQHITYHALERGRDEHAS
jgi:hypothetical protein